MVLIRQCNYINNGNKIKYYNYVMFVILIFLKKIYTNKMFRLKFKNFNYELNIFD